MRLQLIYILTLLLAIGCKNQSDNSQTTENGVEEDSIVTEKNNTQQYKNTKWNFGLEYPSDFKVTEGELPGNRSVINIYSKNEEISKPLAIHEKPELAYIAFLPGGFGVDGPSGKRKSINDWEANLNLSFNINKNESRVYLLENGDPWAYFLRFHQAPEKWNETGGIFVHYQIENYKAECISATGEHKPMQQCDPMVKDKVSVSGEIAEESKRKLDMVLESLYFFRENAEGRKALSELIKVKNPLPNTAVNSPLQITGEARGNWFFEAEAPVKLVDKDHKIISRTSIKAKGDWMTSDFVPFAGELIFESPTDAKQGYLIFEKANASGKPELDRKLTLPVRFRAE